MVDSNGTPENFISGVRLSSIVPGTATAVSKTELELTNLDLAMKLHYIKGIYLFENEAVQGFTVDDFKVPMSELLSIYYPTCGRIRRSDSGRPFIKCNDTGVRIVEAQCRKTVKEWLEMEERCLDGCLAYDQVLGPDLGHSPLVFVQFTWFKCGGLAIGLSWAHVLGNASSASDFINTWGQIFAGKHPSKSELHVPAGKINSVSFNFSGKPVSLSTVPPVGDCWKIINKCKMQRQTFRYVTGKNYQNTPTTDIDTIAAMVMKAKRLKVNTGAKVAFYGKKSENGLVTKTAELETSTSEETELAEIIAKRRVVEDLTFLNLEEMTAGVEGADFVVYGGNLTFLNLEEGDFYGLELKGKKPVFVNYMIDGVGDEGVVLVLPGPPGSAGRTVTVVLPEDQIVEVKNALMT